MRKFKFLESETLSHIEEETNKFFANGMRKFVNIHVSMTFSPVLKMKLYLATIVYEE